MKRIICLFAIVSLIFPQLIACEKDKYLFDDYSQFVANFYKYEFGENVTPDDSNGSGGEGFVPDLDTTEPNVPAVVINGFKPIIDYQVSSATNFFGNYAYISSNYNDYLVDIDGNMHILQSNNSTMSDIISDTVQFTDGKIVAKTENGYGALDAFGKIILPFQFDSLKIKDNLILAKKGNKQLIYKDFSLLHEFDANSVVELIDEKYVLINQKLRNLNDLSFVKFGEYYAVDIPNDSIVKISNGIRYGYGNLNDNTVVLEPNCVVASNFSNGIAYVIKYKENSPSTLNMDMPKIIAKNGDVVHDFNSLSDVKPMDISISEHHDGYTIYSIEENYSAIKIDNNAVSRQISLPHKPEKLRIYSNYAIFSEINKLYSVIDSNFVDLTFLSIEPILNNHFIIETEENKFALLDKNLSVLIEDCEEITSSKNTLIVKKNGLYSLYKLNEAN